MIIYSIILGITIYIIGLIGFIRNENLIMIIISLEL